MPKNNDLNDDLDDDYDLESIIVYLFALIEIILYFLYLFLVIIFGKNGALGKTKSQIFLLLNAITNIIKYHPFEQKIIINNIKPFFLLISYVTQFHLIFGTMNNLMKGNNIFKSDKDYSIKNLLYIDILVAIIIFPYNQFIDSVKINFIQNLIGILSFLYFFEHVKNKIDQILLLLNENNKDIIEIAFMEPEELTQIYMIISNLWFVTFFFIIFFYIVTFFQFLFLNSEVIISISLIVSAVTKQSIIFLFFIIFGIIFYLLNKSSNKGQIIQTEDDNNNNRRNNIKSESHKLDIVIDDIKLNEKKKNEDDNQIQIDNLDISNKKENNQKEEEKLDEEDGILKINNYMKETDKLK